MALPAQDAFSGVNGTALPTYSANWTEAYGSFVIQSNAVVSDLNNDVSLAVWDADSFDNDQYAQGVVVNRQGNFMGVAVRGALAAMTAYVYYTKGTNERGVSKFVNGSETALSWTDTGIANGVTMRLEAEGTTITPLQDGEADSTLGADTDSGIASGYAGIYSYLTGEYQTSWGTKIDDWEGGNLGGEPPAPSLVYRGSRLALLGVGR